MLTDSEFSSSTWSSSFSTPLVIMLSFPELALFISVYMQFQRLVHPYWFNFIFWLILDKVTDTLTWF